MLYVFSDETYSLDQRIRFACVAIQQAYFGTSWPTVASLASQGIRRRTKLVADFLLDGNYRIMITDLDLSRARTALDMLWPNAEPEVGSPRDDLWLQAFGYSIAYSIRFAYQSWVFETVDVFHDPKSLRFAHEEAYQSKLREVVHRRASAEVAQARPAVRGRVRIRRIEAVPKPRRGQTYTKFQQGTWLAHWAAKISPPDHVEEGKETFRYRDLTPIVVEAVQKRLKRREPDANRERA